MLCGRLWISILYLIKRRFCICQRSRSASIFLLMRTSGNSLSTNTTLSVASDQQLWMRVGLCEWGNIIKHFDILSNIKVERRYIKTPNHHIIRVTVRWVMLNSIFARQSLNLSYSSYVAEHIHTPNLLQICIKYKLQELSLNITI